MDDTLPSIDCDALAAALWREGAPLVFDVRRTADFEAAPRVIPSALRIAPAAVAGRSAVVYCAHGRAVSQSICRDLRQAGVDARYLVGGIAAWETAGLPTTRFAPPLGESPSQWITRERPKIDRIACPWLVRRFIDPRAEFFYVPTATVREEGRRLGAVPYDIPDVEFSHVGELCSFDAFLERFGLQSPGLARLATIVRGADTGRPELAPQSHGLLAISLGLSANITDDHAMLGHGMVLYDALYTWCRSGAGESHDWKPATMQVRA